MQNSSIVAVATTVDPIEMPCIITIDGKNLVFLKIRNHTHPFAGEGEGPLLDNRPS